MKQTKKSLLLPEPSVRVEAREAAGQSGLMARAMLVVVLSLTLVGAMRWALNITNANARQISTNLTHIQDHYEQQESPATRRGKSPAPKRPILGPILEPE